MKKVLIISGSLPPIACGVGFYAHRLIHELVNRNLDIGVLSTKDVTNDLPVIVNTVPNWRVISLYKMLRAINNSRAEIIHIQYPAVGYGRQLGINFLPYAIRLFKPHLKILITLHEYHQSRWIGKLRNRFTVLPAHKIFVSNRQDLAALGGSSNKVSVVPIGANFDVAKPNPKIFKKIVREQGLDENKPILIFFGYAYPAKKLEVLIDALSEPELQDYQALLLTSFDKKSDYRRMLTDKIDRLNQHVKRVGVTGFMPEEEVSAILQEGKYFVLPLSNPLNPKSGTAIAAIQHGLLVLSRGTADPAVTAPFSHLKNCYLMDEVNGRSIAEAIRHLEESPDVVRAMLQGAEKLKKYFSWKNILEEHIKIYRGF
jgi:glycosyltransferase involved in cell wall biosynthesis